MTISIFHFVLKFVLFFYDSSKSLLILAFFSLIDAVFWLFLKRNDSLLINYYQNFELLYCGPQIFSGKRKRNYFIRFKITKNMAI